MNTVKPQKLTNNVKPQSATVRFHVPVNMASCVFVRQNKFCPPKTTCPSHSVRDGFLQSRNPLLPSINFTVKA
jgi:hypothetical protein